MECFTVIGLTLCLILVVAIIHTLISFGFAKNGQEDPLKASYVVIVLLLLIISIFIVEKYQEVMSESDYSCNYITDTIDKAEGV